MDAQNTQLDPALQESLDATSVEFIGRWNRLISTTNWEKGRIICQWRDEMAAADAPASSCTDEAWAQRVGYVTPQHVGRLRRVFQRFGATFEQYPGLFWSHFQAAIEWSDAEMYLEGAVQNDWSVSQMREQRWEAMGGAPELKPSEQEIVAAEIGEDELADEAQDEMANEPVAKKARQRAESDDEEAASADPAPWEEESAAEPVRPFANLPPLPNDLGEAFERFKLAILNHKIAGWQEISRDDVLRVLDALRQMAVAE